MADLLHEHSVNAVIISAKRSFFDQVEAAVRACEFGRYRSVAHGRLLQNPDFANYIRRLLGNPSWCFRAVPEASWQGVGKQLLDFFGAPALLIVLAPALALVALLIRFTTPGPIFFRQQRSGLNGRPFTIYKFRTMETNAEQRKHEIAAMNEMSGPVFKLVNDPRITRLGDCCASSASTNCRSY